MYDSHTVGVARIHFALQCAAGQVLFWALFLLWGVPGSASEERWMDGVEASLLLLGVGLLEIVLRRPSARIMCGLSKEERWAVSHRQMLFVLGALAGNLLVSQGQSYPGLFLVSFFVLHAAWTVWWNVIGFRLVHRRFYRRWMERSRVAAERPGKPAVAQAAEITVHV